MASLRTSDAQTAFLVERYLPAIEVAGLEDSVARVAKLCVDSTRVQYLNSVYLPTEDICFCLFRAPSSAAVRTVNQQAHFPFDRITDVVLHFPLNT